MIRALWLPALTLLVGCGGEAPYVDPTATDPNAYVVVALDPADTAVGQTLALRVAVQTKDGYDMSYYATLSATCSGTACTVGTADYDVQVSSAVAETVNVTVTAKIAGETNVYSATFPISFRTPTKIAILRGLDDSPPGSAFAMAPGDQQVWNVSAADDRGPLRTPDDAITAVTDLEASGPTCVESDPSIYRHNPAKGLWCTFGSEVPTTFHFLAKWRDVTRTETVKVISFADVVSADLMRCVVPATGFAALVPIEEKDVLCEAVTSLTYTNNDCITRPPHVLTTRLVLGDGTIALGAARYLSNGDLTSESGAIDLPSGTGTITGRFGAAVISVPYDVAPRCGY